MTIHAVIFDIGGVLETTPDLGVTARWEQIFHLRPGEMDEKLQAVWRAGSIGKITEEEVYRQIGAILCITPAQVEAFMADIWREYLGTLNTPLADYFRGLRPRVRTAIISNSFVGARRREQEAYQFEDMCDFILYSHEEGISKPAPQIYQRACQRLGLPPAEILFLDNVQVCVDGARAVGMQAILYKDTDQAIAEIERLLQR